MIESIISGICLIILVCVFVVASVMDYKEKQREKEKEWNFKISLLEKLDDISNGIYGVNKDE